MHLGILLLSLPQAASPPFAMELPPGYGPFHLEEGSAHAWVSLEEDGVGRFGLSRMEVQASGADPARIAQALRARRWAPMLAEVEHEITHWQGNWAQRKSAGNRIQLETPVGPKIVLEYLAVGGTLLLLGTWEGPMDGAERAAQAWQTLVLPNDWWPVPPPKFDQDSGLGAGVAPQFGFGHFDLILNFKPQPWTLEVQLNFQPGPLFATPEVLFFRMPQGPDQEVRSQDGMFSCSYTLDLEQIPSVGQNHGISVHGRSVVASHPSWLAIPNPPNLTNGPLAAPSWELQLTTAAFDACLSSGPPIHDQLNRTDGTRLRKFERVPAGQAWPYFAAGPMQEIKVLEHSVSLPPGAAATHIEPVIQAFDQFSSEQARLWADSAPWALYSLPGCGDRILPRLMLLDQNHRWLQSPLDAPWLGSNRLFGIAKMSASRLFGLRLRGLGTARGFLEASLCEWAAWRLLRETKQQASANQLFTRWQEHDSSAGSLQTPLSMIPMADLQGEQRLLSRGALVWQALANKVGLGVIDSSLQHFLEGEGFLSTEALRLDLEHRTKIDLQDFFNTHIYGTKAPKFQARK